MTTVVTRLFDTYDHARQAVQDLEASGISHDNISLVASNADNRYGTGTLTGGTTGTVAVVTAYSVPTLEADLAVYRSTFGLPACGTADGCLRIVGQQGAATPPRADADRRRRDGRSRPRRAGAAPVRGRQPDPPLPGAGHRAPPPAPERCRIPWGGPWQQP